MTIIPIQFVNLGNYANDGTGDDLRSAFEKVNSNFNLLLQNIPSSLNQDPTPRLAGNLNLNGKNLLSSAPVQLNTPKLTVSGPVQASNFIGQISDITNHSLTNLSDVEYIKPPVNEDGLVYRNGIWQPGAVQAAFSTVDGGAASSVFILDDGAIIDGGLADDGLV